VSGVSPEVTVDDDLGLDHTWQYFQDRPAADADEDVDGLDQEAEAVVYATEPTAEGEVRTEGVPDAEIRGPDEPGQATLDDYQREWSV
jgi:hypothetical protein